MKQTSRLLLKNAVAASLGTAFLLGLAAQSWAPPPPPGAGTYTSTWHGNSAAGVDRSDTGPLGGALGDSKLSSYAKGNCAHCHEMHGSITGGEPKPVGGTADLFSLFRSNYGAGKNEVCYYCHEVLNVSGTAVNYGRYDIYRGKAIYAAGSHNTSGTMIWPLAGPPGPKLNDAGNCNNCHNPHGWDDGSATRPVPIQSMLFSREDVLCTTCHDASGPATSNILTDVTKTYGHDVTTTAFDDVHDVTTETTAANNTAHVQCVDCHNPHAARGTNRTAGSTGNAIGATSPLYGVPGVDFTSYPTGYDNENGATAPPDPRTWTAAATITFATATKEYQICFKCHSSANGSADDWDGPTTGVTAWTNTALEFSPNNASFHPIVTGLNNSTSTWSSGALATTRMVAPWNVAGNMGTQTMYCTDCHESDSGIAGPHGSATRWMLAGARKAWPYTTAAGNGTSAGTFWTPNNYTTGAGIDRLFCNNCHQSLSSPPHNNTSQHWNLGCVNCHIRVPHGGKIKRLLATTDIPARYYPNGAGGGTVSLTSVDTGASTAISDCQASCAGEHSAARPQSW